MDNTNLPAAQSVEFPDFDDRRSTLEGRAAFDKHFDLIRSVKVRLAASLGGATLTVGELIELKDGAIVKLERAAGEPVDLILEGQVIARGHLVAVDENFGVRISDIAALAP